MEPGDLFTAIVWAIVPAAVLLTLIYWLDRYEKEPVRLLAVAFVFGAVVAPLVAYLIQRLLGVPTSMAVHNVVPESRLNLTTPVVEEVVKGLAVLAVFLLARYEFDSLLDGLVYGAVVGVGFGAAANFVAILATPTLGGASVDATPSLFAAMVAGLNHVFYVGIIGLALASARGGSNAKVLGALVLGVAVALGFHLLHDYLPSFLAEDSGSASGTGASWLASLPNLLGLVGLGVLIVWATSHEADIVSGELADEVSSGVVLADEYQIVTNPLRRSSRLLSSLFREGEDVWRARRRLYVQEVELAFRKHHGHTGRMKAGEGIDEEEYRRRIAEARARIDAHAERVR